MIKKLYTLPLFILTLASCASTQDELVYDEQALNDDAGIIIAQSEFKGRQYAVGTEGSVSDCSEGVGLGITVKSALADESFIFDKQENPCPKAELVFDGASEIHSRSADPTINIVFNDEFGPMSRLNNVEKASKTATVLSDATAGSKVSQDVATKQFDKLGLLDVEYNSLRASENKNYSQETFKQILKDSLKEEKEIVLSQARALVRQETAKEKQAIIDDKNKLAIESANMTEKNRQIVEKLTERTDQLEQAESTLYNLEVAKQVQESNYEQKLAVLEKRVADYAQLALELKLENQRLVSETAQANRALETDLKVAEDSAEAARYAAVLAMAEDLSTDEKLANALHDSQRKALYRKAERLQSQADTLAYHANADKVFNKPMQDVYEQLQNNMQPAFEGKVARVVGVPLNQEPSFEHVQLLLKENDKSANELLLEILADVQPMLGSWTVDWKLASHNLQIKDEKWNVTAETNLLEFFEFIKQKVKQIHGVDLNIEYFDETRRIVITDGF